MASKIPLNPFLKTGYLAVLLSTGIYFGLLGLLTIPVLQHHAFYLHRVQFTWFKNLDAPESFGFMHNQVTPFSIKTPDGETLYAWHVLPLELYRHNEASLIRDPSGFAEDVTQRKAFQLLRDDPEARLVIYLHGTAGTVAQGWRPHNYRTMYSGSPSKIHVLTVDYRGYGRSTGLPFEDGVIADAVTLTHWATHVAGVPADRIVLVGQSLGTAVAVGLAHFYAKLPEPVSFAGIVLIAPFTDVPTLMETYKMGGYVPILSPLSRFAGLRSFFNSYIYNTWKSNDRIAELIKLTKNHHITIIHSEDDISISYEHSNSLFYHAVNATTTDLVAFETFDATKSKTDLGEGGWVSEWKSERGFLRQEMLKYGGHDRLVAYPVIAMAVLRSFQAADPNFCTAVKEAAY